MRIDSGFDGGNIEVLEIGADGNARLAIRRDANAEFYQWFHFRLSGAAGVDCRLAIVNAGGAAYAKGWDGYRAVVSADRKRWRRVPCDYAEGVLTIRCRPEADAVWLAYFAPYSMERHADLVASCLASPLARLEVPGSSLDGQPIDLLRIGEAAPGRRACWVLARQHPGETMAEWWMDGFLGRLLDPDDGVARGLLERAVFHVVPNMNPDGSRRGHLRTNAAGANLNREWQAPSLERSPEVFHIRRRMEETGVDFCLDVHGDEILPYVFFATTSGIPSFSDRQRRLLEAFKAAQLGASAEFQTQHGYGENPPGRANLTMCGNWTAERFGCLSVTLEMPFKDAANAPDEEAGWSPERSARLGASTLDALAAVIDDLR